jgi:hypothetical protein
MLECDLWDLCFMLVILFAACRVVGYIDRCGSVSVVLAYWWFVSHDLLLPSLLLGYVWCGHIRYCEEFKEFLLEGCIFTA